MATAVTGTCKDLFSQASNLFVSNTLSNNPEDTTNVALELMKSLPSNAPQYAQPPTYKPQPQNPQITNIAKKSTFNLASQDDSHFVWKKSFYCDLNWDIQEKVLNLSNSRHRQIFKAVASQLGFTPGRKPIEDFVIGSQDDSTLRLQVVKQLYETCKIFATIRTELISNCKLFLDYIHKLIIANSNSTYLYDINIWIQEALTLDPFRFTPQLTTSICCLNFLLHGNFKYQQIKNTVNYMKACLTYPDPNEPVQLLPIDSIDKLIINHIAGLSLKDPQIDSEKLNLFFRPFIDFCSSKRKETAESNSLINNEMSCLKLINSSLNENDLFNMLKKCTLHDFSIQMFQSKISFWLAQGDLIYCNNVISLNYISASKIYSRFRSIRESMSFISHQSAIENAIESLKTDPLADINEDNIPVYYKSWWFATQEDVIDNSNWRRIESPIHRMIKWLFIEVISEDRALEEEILFSKIFQYFTERVSYMPFDKPFAEELLFRYKNVGALDLRK